MAARAAVDKDLLEQILSGGFKGGRNDRGLPPPGGRIAPGDGLNPPPFIHPTAEVPKPPSIDDLFKRRNELEQFFKLLPDDVTGMNQEELQTAVDNLNEYKKLSLQLQPQIQEQRKQELINRIRSNLAGTPDIRDTAPGAENAPQEVADLVLQGKNMQEIESYLGRYRGRLYNYNFGNYIKAFRDAVGSRSSDYYKGEDFIPNISEQLGKIKPILEEMIGKQKSEKAIQEFLKDLPAQQTAAIDELEKTLGASQERLFREQFLPMITQQLNTRGLLFGGDLASSLAEQSAKLSSAREAQIAPLRTQSAFQAQSLNYENLLRQALDSTGNLQSALGFARQMFAQQKQNQFAASQNELNRQFQQNMSDRDYAMKLALMGGIGNKQNQLLGSLAGTALGSLAGFIPGAGIAGALLGSQLGGQIGGGIGSYF